MQSFQRWLVARFGREAEQAARFGAVHCYPAGTGQVVLPKKILGIRPSLGSQIFQESNGVSVPSKSLQRRSPDAVGLCATGYQCKRRIPCAQCLFEPALFESNLGNIDEWPVEAANARSHLVGRGCCIEPLEEPELRRDLHRCLKGHAGPSVRGKT